MLIEDVRTSIARQAAFDAVIRVRTSTGWYIVAVSAVFALCALSQISVHLARLSTLLLITCVSLAMVSSFPGNFLLHRSKLVVCLCYWYLCSCTVVRPFLYSEI